MWGMERGTGMNPRARNYVNWTAGGIGLYFLILAIYTAHEENVQKIDLDPSAKASLSPLWMVLIFLLGAFCLATWIWYRVSKKNTIEPEKVLHTSKKRNGLVLSALGGGAGALVISVLLAGSLPSFKLSFPVFEPVATVQPSQTISQAPEESHPFPIPDLPPLLPSDNQIASATGANTYTDTQTISTSLSSANPDQSVILALEPAALTLDRITITKNGSSSLVENAFKYGLNSAILASPGTSINLLGTTVNADGSGAGAIAANGQNASVSLNDAKIQTRGDESPVCLAAYQGSLRVFGGLIYSYSAHSPAFVVRSGSSIEVDSATVQTDGTSSAILRASGSFTGMALDALAAQGTFAQIEPGAQVSLSNSDMSAGGVQEDTGLRGLFIFDNQEGTAKSDPAQLSIDNSSMFINTDEQLSDIPAFRISGANALIRLSQNTFSGMPYIAVVENGTLNLECSTQDLYGRILGDGNSTITLSLMAGSEMAGSLNTDQACPNVTLNMEAGTTLTLTSDTYLSALNNQDSTNSNIDANGFHLYVNGEQVK